VGNCSNSQPGKGDNNYNKSVDKTIPKPVEKKELFGGLPLSALFSGLGG
jgi:hypothetical protein